MRWPWMWRSLAEGELALKDEQIVTLSRELARAQHAVTRAEAERDRLLLHLLDRVNTAARAELPRAERVVPVELDLAEVDPSDNQAVRDLALNEMPAKANASLLLLKMESIRKQIHAARFARSQRAREVGSIAAAPAEAPPPWVAELIDHAVTQGKENARNH